MARAGTLTQSALLECDPADQSVRVPREVYTTPVFLTDTTDTSDRVAIWAERNVEEVQAAGDTESYYFVRYDWAGDVSTLPTCTIKTEEDFTLYGGGELPSPSYASDPASPEGDGSSSTPTVVLGGTTRKAYFPTLMGWVNSHEFDSDGWPGTGASHTHYSSEVTDADADAGTDTSGFVDPERQVMVFGTRCSARGVGDCDVNLGAALPREWGRVFLTDLSGASSASALDTLDLEA